MCVCMHVCVHGLGVGLKGMGTPLLFLGLTLFPHACSHTYCPLPFHPHPQNLLWWTLSESAVASIASASDGELECNIPDKKLQHVLGNPPANCPSISKVNANLKDHKPTEFSGFSPPCFLGKNYFIFKKKKNKVLYFLCNGSTKFKHACPVLCHVLFYGNYQ